MQDRQSEQRLDRLRRAVRATGLVVDPAQRNGYAQALVVSNRLAQTSIRFLRDRVDATAAADLREELRELVGGQELSVLTDETGFTFYHVVQYIYAYARQAAPMPAGQDFCEEMGYGGGGIEVAPHREVISLVSLLISALPPNDDSANVGVLIRELFPQVMGRIFPSELLAVEVDAKGPRRAAITLAYADSDGLTRALDELELGQDAGEFFLNSARHIQGTMRLAWDTFADRPDLHFRFAPLLSGLSPGDLERVAAEGSYTWQVEWDATIRLRRQRDGDEILGRARAVLQALELADREFYLERIKTLEHRIQELEEDPGLHQMVGRSEPMRRVHAAIDQVAPTDATVLILGESGTGKELVARAIHDASRRADGPFVGLNCAAFPESLLESELFGHERGAFTGADRRKPGRFELAEGGTLFLDEIGDISLATQVKLLRFLETRSFERIGGGDTIASDVRILAATNRDLTRLIEEGRYREDFYFRLNVLPIVLPPLRDRLEDIPELAEAFLEREAAVSGKATRLSRGALRCLMDHTWPGNVRDLQNVIQRALILYARDGRPLTEQDILRAMGQQSDSHTPVRHLSARQRFILQSIDEAGCAGVSDLLETVSQSQPARAISRRTIQNDLRRLSDRGYLTWHKEGSARAYETTETGRDLLHRIADPG